MERGKTMGREGNKEATREWYRSRKLELLEKYSRCLQELKEQDIETVARIISNARCVYTAGNGGSAATASHFAADLNRIGVQAICLSDNTAVITGYANDISYEKALSLQLKTMDSQDVLVVLSVSGKSYNLMTAVDTANSRNATTIAFLGSGGGYISRMVKHAIVLSSEWYGEVESIHSCVCHILPVLVKETIEQGRLS